MTNSKKQILNEIALLDNKLKYQQAEVRRYKQELSEFFGHKYITVLAGISIVLLTWKLVKFEYVGRFIKKSGGNFVKELIELGLLSVLTYFKQNIYNSFFKKSLHDHSP